MQHFRLFTLISVLLLGMIVLIPQHALASAGKNSSASSGEGKCCQTGEVAAKDGTSPICCKGSKEDGKKVNEACCKKAGGQMKNGKCCKCPSGDTSCGK